MKKVMVGTVISDKMEKTIVVMVERLVRHRMYNRIVKKRTNFKVHDEKNEAHTGDRVKIVECRPLSKTKRSRLSEVVEKAEQE